MKKTILELDLIGYSDKARELEEHGGVKLVMGFNDQIRQFVDQGLTAAGVIPSDVIVQSTGDGAVVVLDEAEQAHEFAEAVNGACRQHNKGKALESTKRWFRIAATTGEVEIHGSDLAGVVIANAVRLETAGESGHFLVDIATFDALPANYREQYLPEEDIRGKRDELIPARRRVFLDDASPRPDHVVLTMRLERSAFNDVAAKALVRDIARTLQADGSAITIEGIRPGSVKVTLRFRDSAILAGFIKRHVGGEPGLRAVFDDWKVQRVSYHALLAVDPTAELAGLVAPEPGGPSHKHAGSGSSDEAESPTVDQWRQTTIEELMRAFRALSVNTRSEVARIVGFPPDADDDQLRVVLDQFIRRHSAADTFDVRAISLIVAEIDALLGADGRHPNDFAVLTEIEDLLMPLCLHPGIKAEVARQMERHDGAIISEAVALVIGAELVAAPADGRSVRFRLDDEGEIAGEGLLKFVDAAIGDPDPDKLICAILRDLAEQLAVSLDQDIADEPDVRKRIFAWADALKLPAEVHRTRKRRRHYCVVNPPRNSALRAKLVELLVRVRIEVPDLVFFELHRKAKTKAGEEVVMQILKDRFRDGGRP